MSRPLEPVSAAGWAALALAEHHAATFASLAGECDRTRRFPVDHVAAMRASGLAAATVARSLGGGGVDQLRDLMVLTNRLARADSSMGICASMHLSFCWSLSRAAAAGHDAAARLAHATAAGGVWFCSAVTESGTNYFHPRTTVRPDAEGRWIVDGDKVFATGSPAATHLNVNARLGDHLATVVVPADAPGVLIADDWNGLGMRASGSGQVELRQVRIDPSALVLRSGPWGHFSAAALTGRAWGNVGNLAAMVGIAEAARDEAVQRVRQGTRVGTEPLSTRATVRHRLAELDVDLAAARAVLARLGDDADRLAADPPADLPTAHGFMASFQETKLWVNRLSIAVVDRALDLAGGRGYVDDQPAARRYRDVRAGPFMQPFSPHEALAYIGAVAAGTEPDVEA